MERTVAPELRLCDVTVRYGDRLVLDVPDFAVAIKPTTVRLRERRVRKFSAPRRLASIGTARSGGGIRAIEPRQNAMPATSSANPAR